MVGTSVKWKYDIGDTICDNHRDLTVTNRYTTEYKYNKNNKQYTTLVKHYNYICNVCGYDKGDVYEGNLNNKHSKCPCCSGKIVVKGVNDILTIRPDLAKYFVDINDALTHTIGSSKKVKCKCPICNSTKYIIIYNLSKHGFVCNKCSDGISYPEKFIMSILSQLDVEYITQYSIDGYKYKYDFYLPDFNAIIETHGEQHYKNAFMKYTIEDVKLNDLNKKNIALQNNINNYIELDCSKSDVDYIKTSIYNNIFLRTKLNLNSVDWMLCHKESLRNKLIEVCKYWNTHSEDTSTSEVAKEFYISRNTVIKYLCIGNKIGLCKYDKSLEYKKAANKRTGKHNHMSRSVTQLSKEGLFVREWDCIADIEKELGFKHSNISKCCKGQINFAYGFIWKYTDNYISI